MALSFSNTYFYLLVFSPFIPVIWPLGAFQESDFAFFGLWFVAGLYAFFLGFGKNDKFDGPGDKRNSILEQISEINHKKNDGRVNEFVGDHDKN